MKKYFLAIASLIGVISISGCDDYLDKVPDNRTELDTKDKIAELLVMAYPKATYVSFTEAMSDNSGDKGSDAGKTDLINTEPFFWKDFSTDGIDTPAFYWDECYLAIAHANMALEAIEVNKNKISLSAEKGEALLCRAYAHFMLVTLFSKTYDKTTASSDMGIPYVTEVEKVVSKKYERGTVASVYANIEKDLTEGLQLISDDGYKVPKYHFTKAAANSFAARFFLFKKDYENVVKHANSVLGSDVTSKFRDWAQYSKATYYEFIQNYTKATEPANLLLQEATSLWGNYLQTYRYAFSSDLNSQMFGSDNVTGKKWLYKVYGANELYYGIPKFKVYEKKTSVDATTYWPYIMVPLFTAEESFFNMLEAKLALDAPSSEIVEMLNKFVDLRVEINKVDAKRKKEILLTEDNISRFYGKGSLKENLLACILDLKRVEFLHEGMRWFDILRHNMKVVHKTFDGEILNLEPNDPRRVIQIPSKAINSGIPKNPR